MDNPKDVYKSFMNVGELLDFIEKHNIPKDAKILVQYTNDSDVERLGIKKFKRKGDIYKQYSSLNDRVKSGEIKNFPIIPDEELEKVKDEYIVVNTPIVIKEDNNLYLDIYY